MKGISGIIALMLTVVVAMSIGMVFWTYTNGYFSRLTQTGENNTKATLQSMSSCMRIEESFQNKVYIRNCGKGVIDESSLVVYVDDSPVGFVQSPSVINEGKSGTVTITSSVTAGQHTLRVFNSKTQATAYFTSDGSGNFRII